CARLTVTAISDADAFDFW
nr:immunoglobulin heavy chain junction region [Macaca mulatta]MOY18018.1 immunoglobulin heavy chain junction region [Macaca mulatta]MOY18100.1 immunoglobulin heavy chain junction region [Macaca mulatta]MOY18126.1 immunoglobulin heavy chain junction region [Macaca mulatta]MOY18128.1 immunoglobulin heavy chain junction region [Macaca mulatta]